MSYRAASPLRHLLQVVPWILVGFVAAILVSGGLLGLAEVISSVWAASTLYLYGFLILLAVVLFVVVVLSRYAPWLIEEVFDNDPSMIVGALVGWFLIFIVASSQFLRYWSMQHGGFDAGDSTYWSWVGYGFSWVLDNGLGNFGQIYGLTLTEIQPITDATRAFLRKSELPWVKQHLEASE